MILGETHTSGGGLVKTARATVEQAWPCIRRRFGQTALGMAASPRLPPVADFKSWHSLMQPGMNHTPEAELAAAPDPHRRSSPHAALDNRMHCMP